MKVQINLNTNQKILIELYEEIAPLTVQNFVKLVKQNFYNGTCFHRVISDFMIQTGGYLIDDNTLKPIGNTDTIKGEFASNGIENSLKHELGTISMARTSDPNSASSEFFICATTCTWLDGEYAAFGRCIDEESKNVVLEISKYPTMNIGGGFTDFLQYDIHIENIELLDE